MPSSKLQVPKKLQGPNPKAPAVPGPEGRLPVATGEAQRNPWNETPPVKSSAPTGRLVWTQHGHAPLRGAARVGPRIPRVPRAGARSTRGYRPACLRHAGNTREHCAVVNFAQRGDAGTAVGGAMGHSRLDQPQGSGEAQSMNQENPTSLRGYKFQP
jgi:hypothetical protein